MAGVLGIRRFRVVAGLCMTLIVLGVMSQPAAADTRVVTSGETRLEVNVSNFVKLLNDGIFINPIAPARLEFGSQPAAIFPVGAAGVVDPVLKTAVVPHQGGLHIAKDSIGMAIDATNVTVSCLPLVGCRALNTANNLLPNELAEIHDVTFTDNRAGTATITGRAVIGPVTSLVLNTLFKTQVFQNGMELGPIRSTFRY
jgi:hypothetical protein